MLEKKIILPVPWKERKPLPQLRKLKKLLKRKSDFQFFVKKNLALNGVRKKPSFNINWKK